MRRFNDKDFLLYNKTSKKLYNRYAKAMPIIDYHCHLSPKEIYEDKTYENLAEVWLDGDHYKWRAMRTFGIDEEYITGNASDYDKFLAWAKVLPSTIGNPLYHWSHMELKNYFKIKDVLNEKTASTIYEKANSLLKSLSTRKMIEMNNVRIVCTTDDPIDSLQYHQKIKEEKNFKVIVLPAFRPDKAVNIELNWFKGWVNDLSLVVHFPINSFDDFLKALTERIIFFHSVGCKLADHALDEVLYMDSTKEEAATIFLKGLKQEALTLTELSKYKGFMLKFFAKEYAKKGWAQQYHIGALRNCNTKWLQRLGPDTGFDAINDQKFALNLTKLFDALVLENALPKTICYCLNPSDNYIMAALINSYQEEVPGKMQFGSAWWFNDHKDGMISQLKALANVGLISKFIGMLTDSRSFLSYSRHDYFRRILCNLFGELIDSGEYPNDLEFVGKMIKDICYYNVLNYLDF